MTTRIEDRLRVVLQDMAEEIQPSPPPVELEPTAVAAAGRRLVLATVAAVAAVAVLVAAAALLHDPRPRFLEPVDRPPKTLRLSGTVTPAPGRSLVALIPAKVQGSLETRRVFLQRTAGAAVGLTNTERVASAYSQHLSWDGTRVIRQGDDGGDPRLEIVNLLTGSVNELAGRIGYCPQLSPDNRTVAILSWDGDHLELLDARTGETLRRAGPVRENCAGLGWSPDGRLLVIPGPNTRATNATAADPAGDGSTVIDKRGRTVARLPHRVAVNSGMSWSPDGRSILLYARDTGRYSVRDVTDATETILAPPADAVRPLGWAADRVVWLTGQPGDQRLVSTDRTGADPQPWMRLDVGDLSIETVQWSRNLSGRPASDR